MVGRLLAVQSQDLRAATLAIRARSTGTTAAGIAGLLGNERALVVTWLNRGTLHMVRSEDYWWLHALTSPGTKAAVARRLRQEGLTPGDAERARAVIAASLESAGALTREQLAAALEEARIPTGGQALIQVLAHASMEGLIVRAPMSGGRQAYVLVREWLGDPPPFDRARALAELARRFLAGHAPAGPKDLAKWSGLALRDTTAAFAAVAGELVEDRPGLWALRGPKGRSVRATPRLLGAFDPLLFGWTSREPILGSHTSVVTINGIFRAIALVDGQAAGTWTIEKGTVALRAFGPITTRALHSLERDAADVGRFLGLAEHLGLVVTRP